jgi:hypothetical protein
MARTFNPANDYSSNERMGACAPTFDKDESKPGMSRDARGGGSRLQRAEGIEVGIEIKERLGVLLCPLSRCK